MCDRVSGNTTMTPTRQQIQEKLTETNSDFQAVSDWLDEVECPDTDKAKILDDLDSYV